MPYNQNIIGNTGSYVPTTFIYDVAQLHAVNVNSPEFKELLVRLYQTLNQVVLSLNLKDTGYYMNQEYLTSQVYFNPVSNLPKDYRQIFRTTYNIGPLGAGLTNTAHGLPITTTWQFTRIYGVANDSIGKNYYPLPFASAGGAANIELRVDATNIKITNNSGVAFDSCTVVLEYLKN